MWTSASGRRFGCGVVVYCSLVTETGTPRPHYIYFCILLLVSYWSKLFAIHLSIMNGRCDQCRQRGLKIERTWDALPAECHGNVIILLSSASNVHFALPGGFSAADCIQKQTKNGCTWKMSNLIQVWSTSLTLNELNSNWFKLIEVYLSSIDLIGNHLLFKKFCKN